MHNSVPAPPYHLAPGRGSTHWWAPGLHRVELATGNQTNGMFALTEVTAAARYTSPFHVHRRDDEAIYVLDGVVDLFVGDAVFAAGPGSFTFMPREIPHGYAVRSEAPARMQIIMSPPGFERFFGSYAASRDQRPDAPGLSREDAGVILARDFGIELVTPPAGYPPSLEWADNDVARA